ncbi:Ig heavy chain Mem5-like protein [Sarotherodon galilaeus]
MACASQSALDYVKSARYYLVRTLKGFTEIVENLSMRGVFSEEDVNKIKTEGDDFDKSGRIVDSVIEKGEEACYEFLRIIDTKRKTPGWRSLSFLENPESSSSPSNTFDLNYWISCFSFREDINMDVTYLQELSPCHRYQQKLKSEAQKITERSWFQSKEVLFNKQSSLSYTSLVLDTQGQATPSKIKKSKIKKSRKLRPKKLKTYIPENKHGTSPSELLKTYERKILLVGKPGTGKTAVVHQMLKLWSERDNKDLDYMFYFDVRETPNITEVHKLEDLLFSVFSEPDEVKDEVLEDIKYNADSVTIIFDGITDIPSTSVVFKLIQKTLLPEAKIIITCRPEVESADFLLGWDCLRVEVKGFSEQGIREYLSKNLSDEHLNKVLCNLELFSLCHVPMYALMVVSCFSFEGSEFCPHPCTVTEIYLNILHFCIQRNVGKTSENESTKWDAVLSLSEAAFYATEGKTLNITSLPKLDSCANLAFLSRIVIQVGPTVKKPLCAFLHYTVQEFFAALWLLKNPERTSKLLQQCLVQRSKHMKHLVPFLCGLLNEKNTHLVERLIPSQQLRDTSGWFFKELLTIFVDCSDTEDCEMDLMFLCQCLYESQSPEACLCLLDKLDYCIDLSGETLDPQQCYAVSYIISQSKERKIELNLEDTTVSKQGIGPFLGCSSKLQRSDSLSRQLWTISLLSEVDVDYMSLLDFTENQLHLPVNSETQLYDRAVRVLEERSRKVKVCLHCDHRVCQSVSTFLFHCLPHIHSLSVDLQVSRLHEAVRFFVNLFCAAAEREQQTGEKILELLSSVCTYQTFPVNERGVDDDDYIKKSQCNFLLDLYFHVKDCETKTGLSVLPSLQSVFQSAPAVWSINLSERKTSILLEVLKLQPEKKQVKLTGCSHEESEVRSFLQCLPYISQLSVYFEDPDEEIRFFVNLFCAAAERDKQTGEKILELLSSVCTFNMFPFDGYDDDDDLDKYRCDLLLDMCSDVKDCETKTGLSVLPSLQSVFQSAPAVWSINLSERKTSILLEVLKLQPEKKHVKLTDCSHEQSEVRSFLQCLPYISQLSIAVWRSGLHEETRFFVNLFCAAAEREQQTGEKILELLSSMGIFDRFPFNISDDDDDDNDDMKKYQCNLLLDLYSQVKDYETKTGLSVLPSLQSVFQSAPAVWSIKLSERKTSILLEVLKLQPEKKHVKLTGCSHEQSVVRSFLQCLPYISQLSVDDETSNEAVRFFVNLFCAAAEREQQTGEKILELLSSVCTYQTFPFINPDVDDLKKHQCDFLLDLYSQVKDYEAKTGLSVLPSLQSVFQTAPAVWFINLSERKTSILLEVLKLQPEKKQVELTGCSHEESEVRSFLHCVPYISQLRCDAGFFQRVCSCFAVKSKQEVQQMFSLLQLLEFNLFLTGCLTRVTCSFVGRVLGLCGANVKLSLKPRKMSAKGASLLFKHTSTIKSLRLSTDVVLLLLRWVRTNRVSQSLVIEKLSIIESLSSSLSDKVLLRVVSTVASLLRVWTIRQLDLSELCIPAQHLTALLLHRGPLSIRLKNENLQQFPVLLHEIKDQELTQSFCSKVGGDLTSCCLTWEVLYFLLQHSSGQTITVNLKKISCLEENFSHLLPFLDRIVFQRSSPSFVLSAIRHIHKAHSNHSVPGLLRSLGHVINLTCTELDSDDFSALLFILHHSDTVKLNLLWTSIPAESTESVLFGLDKVSQLSIDRTLLLRFVHCFAAAQQRASLGLLRALQHRLDLSCTSFMDLAQEEQKEALRLTAADCRAVSTILGYSSQETQLDLRDCEVDDIGLDLLLPVLDRVRLRASKAVLLQLVSLISLHSQRDLVKHAESLWRALDGELDLSHTTLDQRTCSSLAQLLDSSEGLIELDLSHCELTDQLLHTLIPQLHKVQVLDLSHNNLTDASTNMLLHLTSIRSSLQAVSKMAVSDYQEHDIMSLYSHFSLACTREYANQPMGVRGNLKPPSCCSPQKFSSKKY